MAFRDGFSSTNRISDPTAPRRASIQAIQVQPSRWLGTGEEDPAADYGFPRWVKCRSATEPTVCSPEVRSLDAYAS